MHKLTNAKAGFIYGSLFAAACLAVPAVQPVGVTAATLCEPSRVQVSQLDTACRNFGLARLPLGLTVAELRRFEPAMRKISAATRMTIVAEGVPLRAELTDEETANLQKALVSDPSNTVKSTLALIAAAYDYDFESSGGGYLLCKRYSDPTDLPDVTYSEVVRCLVSLLRLTEAYAPTPLDPRAETSGFRFYDSLTQEQQAAAHSRAGLSLALSDLDPLQKQLALATARRVALDSQTIGVRLALQHLEFLHGKNVDFLWTNRTDQTFTMFRSARPGGPPLGGQPAMPAGPIFEYVMPSGHPDFIYQFPLNHGLRINLSGGGSRMAPAMLEQVAPDPAVRRSAAGAVSSQAKNVAAPETRSGSNAGGHDYDPTIPTAQDKLLASGMMSNKLASTVTLEALAESLSPATAKRGGSAGLKVTIDPALIGKPVTVFGGDLIAGNQLIRLASRVYGLQVSTTDNKMLYITMPKAHQVPRVVDLPAEIKRVIPPSLLHAMESQIDRIMALTPTAPGISDQYTTEQRQKFAARLADQKTERTAQTASVSWYYPADRRLIVLATAAVPTPGSPPVSVASLGPEPSRLIALMSLTDGGMVNVRKLLSFEPPRSLTDPSTMRITMKCGEGLNDMQTIPITIKSVDSSGDVKAEGVTIFGRHIPKANL